MDKTITLTRIHNAINRTDRDTIAWEYVPGQSLSEIHSTLPAEINFAVSINGITITEERLAELHPRPGDHILFVPIIGGGDDGKMIGRIIGMIVIAAVSFGIGAIAGAGYLGYSAAALAIAQGGVAGALAAGAIMLVGGLLINTLLPPPKPRVSALGNDYGTSNAYSWSPQSLQQQGIVIPRWYGKNKLYGNVIGGYLESDGDKQYLNALIGLGTGPFSNIPASTMKINDQPIANFQTSVSTPTVRTGLLNQDAIANFQNTVVEHALSQKVTAAASPYIYSVPGTEFDGLEVEVTFPQGLYQVNQATGAFEGQSVDIKVELFDGTNTINITQESNRVVAQTFSRWSLGRIVKIPPSATNPGAFVGDAWIETAAGESDYDRAVDAGYEGAGTYSVPYHLDGDIDPSTGMAWHWFESGSHAISIGQTSYSSVSSNKQKTVRRLWRMFGLAHGSWQVKITRITADNSSSTIFNDVYASTVGEIYTIPFQYPRQGLVGIRALATDTLSGSLRFSCIADCLYVRVYSGTGWGVQYSNNPAWVLFDVLTQPVYSGNPVDGFIVERYDGMDPSRLDVAKFLEWADYCDILCPDGKGGTEKRITFNGGFDAETNLWDAAMQVCQIGGAVLVWNGIKLTLAIDKPSDPVQLFSVGNTGQDSFSESFLSMEDRAAEIEVDFTNSENDYNRDKTSIVNGNIKTVASKVGLQMIGITKSSEAWRIAAKRLAYNEVITRTVSFAADIDAIACTVGDVVLLQSDIPQWGQGGRLGAGSTTTSIVLDQEVTIETGKSYSIMVRTGDDALIERAVTNSPGTTDTITVVSAFSSAPNQYDVYAFGLANIETKPFRVISIQRQGDLSASISCVEYNASIYGVDSGTPVLPTINYSQLNTWPTITIDTPTEQLVKSAGGGIVSNIIINYDKVLDTLRFPKLEVLISESNGAFESYGTFKMNESFSFQGTEGVSYQIVLRALNLFGQIQPLGSTSSVTYLVLGKAAKPANITNLQATLKLNQLTISYDRNTELDILGYEIQIGTIWDGFDNLKLATNYPSNSLTWTPDRDGDVSILVKAIDTSLNYSLNATQLIFSLPALPSVTGLVDYYLNNFIHLKWLPIVDNRPFVYEVRFGDTFNSAMIIGTTLNTDYAISANGTYWVAGKYIVGTNILYSPTPASLTIAGAVLTENVVQTYDEFATGWSGTLSAEVEVDIANRVWLKLVPGPGDGGSMLLEDGTDMLLEDGTSILCEPALVISPSGSYTIPPGHIVDIGSDQLCTLSVQYTALSDSPFALIDSVSDFDAMGDFDGDYAGLSNIQPQLQIYRNAAWGDWQNFIAGPYIGQKFNFRMLLTSNSTSVTAVLSAFSFTVDMPDKFDLQTNVAILSGGSAITYAIPFQIAPNVQVTILNSVAGDKINFLAGPTKTGLTLQITNGGLGVARNCNIFSQSY